MVGKIESGASPGCLDRTAVIDAVRKRLFCDDDLRASEDPPDATYQIPKKKQLLRPNNTGQFAVVFKLIVRRTETAVRVYSDETHATQSAAHYDQVKKYFHAGRPSCLVEFSHYADELEVRGRWYPVLTMKWLRGPQLGAWVVERVKARDAAALRDMAKRWVDLMEELKRFGVVHGDLQHGNVLVVDGLPRLIDYDGMWAPDFGERENLEGGLPAYQHPARPRESCPALDDFSAWVILLALRGLAGDLGLWERHVRDEKAEKDRPLLFGQEHTKPHRDSEAERLWDDLKRSPDGDVRAWAKALRDALDDDFRKVPPFKVVVIDPQEQARAAVRHALAKALAEGDVRRAAAVFNERLLSSQPADAALLERGRQAYRQVAWLDELRDEAGKTRDGRHYVELWDRHGPHLNRIKEAAEHEHRAADWRRRLAALAVLAAALAPPVPSEAAITAASDELLKAGGHPDAAPSRARAESARNRVPLLRELRGLSPKCEESTDRAWCQKWNDALLRDCPEAAPLRTRWDEARARVEILDELRRLADAGLDAPLVALAGRLPDGYDYSLRPRVLRAISGPTLIEALRSAVRAGDERGIARAAGELVAAGGQLPQDLAARVDTARQRVACLDVIGPLARRFANEKVDRQLCAAWDDALLEGCLDADPLRPRCRQARERVARLDALRPLLARFRQGEAREDDVLAATQGLPADYTYEDRDAVQALRMARDTLVALRTALDAEPPYEAGIARAWEQLKRAGGHRDADQYQKRAEEAQRWAPAVERVKNLAPLPRGEEHDRRLCQAWDEGRLDDCPGARPFRPRAEEARVNLNRVAELEAAIASGQEEQIAAASAALAGYPHRFQDVVAQANERFEAYRKFVAAVESGSGVRAVRQAWERLQAAGDHPEADKWRKRAEAMVRLPPLTAARPGESGDGSLVRIYDDAEFDDFPRAEPHRRPYLAARARLLALAEVYRLFQGGAPLEQVVVAAAALPDDYQHPLEERLRTARRQVRVRAEFEVALRAAPCQDEALANAYDACHAAGVAPTDPQVQQRCQRAVRVRDCLARLRKIDPGLRRDDQDRLWLEFWDEPLLAGSADALALHPTDRDIRERWSLWQELDQAIRSGNALVVARLHDDPRLKGYPPRERLEAEIAPLAERGRKANDLLDKLRHGDDAAVRAALDLSCVAGSPDLFAPHLPRLRAVIEAALAEAPLRPGEPPWQIDARRGVLTLRWTGLDWPLFGTRDRRCLVAVHRRRFLRTPDEDEEGTYRPGQGSCRAGFPVTLPEGASRVFVTVWPVVELDPRVFEVPRVVGPPWEMAEVTVKGWLWALVAGD